MCRVQRERTCCSERSGCILWPCQGQNGNPGEDDPQRQRGPDREVRVPPLASAKTVLRWYPRGNCILAQPDRDVPAAPEATLVLPPVPDSVLLLVLAVDSPRLRCDHDVTPPISMMDWTPPPPLACSLTPIHAPTPNLYAKRFRVGACWIGAGIDRYEDELEFPRWTSIHASSSPRRPGSSKAPPSCPDGEYQLNRSLVRSERLSV